MRSHVKITNNKREKIYIKIIKIRGDHINRSTKEPRRRLNNVNDEYEEDELLMSIP